MVKTMRKMTIATLDDLDILLNVARAEFDKHGKQTAIIKNFEESLSDRVRGLYWRWVSVMCAENGDTKDDYHEHTKERIFLPVYLRDPDNHHSLCNAVSTMKGIRGKTTQQEYEMIRKYIVDHVSHMDATNKNMSDVLKQMESEAISLGIVLPKPDDALWDGLMSDK